MCNEAIVPKYVYVELPLLETWVICLCFVLSVPPHTSKSRFHETTNGPALFARWQRSTRTGTTQRSWQLSAWPPDLLTVDEMFKGPVVCLAIAAAVLMEGKRWRSDQKEARRTWFDFLHLLLIWTTLPSQLAGPSPVFLGVTHKRQGYQPQTLTRSHTHKHTCQSSFLQPDALNF